MRSPVLGAVESRRLAELGREPGVLIAVNTQYQWMPHWQRFWPLIAQGRLGELRTIRCSTRTNILEQGPHVPSQANRAAFEECFQIIKKCWTEEMLAFQGKFWKIPAGDTPWPRSTTLASSRS